MAPELFYPHTRDWLWHGWQIRYQFTSAPKEEVGAPILLLHGFGVSGRHWRHNLRDLSAHHRVYTLDLLGFGASEKVPTQYDLQLWVEQVYDFWRSFMAEPMVVVGNSLGALVALMFVHQYPQAVKGIVVISLPDLAELERSIPASVRPVKRFLEATIGGLFAAPLFYLVRQPFVIRSVLRNFVYGAKDAVDEELVEIIASPARERQAVMGFSWLNKGMTQSQGIPTAKKMIALLKVPLLIIWGTNDRVIPAKPAKKLASYSPLAQVVLLDGIGHCPQDECPQRVNSEILQWISHTIV